MTTSWTEASERLSSDSSRCSVLTHSPCRPPLPELNHCCCASKMFAFETRNGRVYKHGSALKERSSSRRQPFVTMSSQQTWLKHERCHFTWSGDVSSFHVNSSYYGTRNLVLVSQWRNQTHMRLLISSLSFILCCVSKNNINLSCTQLPLDECPTRTSRCCWRSGASRRTRCACDIGTTFILGRFIKRD